MVDDAIKEFTLPLRHEDVIRQQARDKNLDPALIAAVIYRESKFRDQTSHAGAKGLMQILPETAHFIARTSGGTEFVRATSPTRRSTSPTGAGTCATCSTATTATRSRPSPRTTPATRAWTSGAART